MTHCLVSNDKLSPLLDLGLQPICNRFLQNTSDDELLHPLKLGLSEKLGLVQLVEPVPWQELVPKVDWIRYREPEAHLDDLADYVFDTCKLDLRSKICGVSYKDASFLERLASRGVNDPWHIDLRSDLGGNYIGAGVEAVQGLLTSTVASKLAELRGPQDLVVARHILEHSYDISDFTAALLSLLADDGCLLIEVPDCERSFRLLDYTTIWEEHTCYFTQDSLKRCFALWGLNIVELRVVEYENENSLVVLAKKGSSSEEFTATFEGAYIDNFAASFRDRSLEVRQKLEFVVRTGGRIALFGAGHLGCAFVNFFDLSDLFSCAIDDHPKKQGLYLPGSRLHIKSSKALVDDEITLTLLAFDPSAEESVIASNSDYVRWGGEFASIFPASNRWLLK